MSMITEAVADGARKDRACEELGVSVRTVQRWRHQAEDGRPGAVRAAPSNKLSEAEREQVLAIANEAAHASLAPHQIAPRLADKGVYVASESTFYRVLREADQQHRRGRTAAALVSMW
jgi:transposase